MTSATAAAATIDLEKGVEPPSTSAMSTPLAPSTLSWADISLKASKREALILDSIDGSISSGKLLAVMGPSGAGKSSLLDALARRSAASGQVLFNATSEYSPRDLMSFVEQDDALLGVLTVHETVTFAARLALPYGTLDIDGHVADTLRSLGLQDVANNRIGTPLQRGISGGQKRRVSIACSVVARPRVLFLDEPTSGLDAASGREVIASIKRLAMEQNMIVLATIHQPNFETFALFDHLLLLARGRVMYNGPTQELDNYLATVLGSPTPAHVNPSDHAIDLVNTEFLRIEDGQGTAEERMARFADAWKKSTLATAPELRLGGVLASQEPAIRTRSGQGGVVAGLTKGVRTTLIISERNVKNYTRNLFAYGVRLAMYIGMGLLLALVWIKLGTNAEKVNDRLSVHFFSVAFLGFMSVAAIPSYLEERSVYIRERSNGLVTPLTYLLANTLTTVPFLFLCTLTYVLIMYWAIGLNPAAGSFFKFLIYLFLAVFAAESQSMLLATLVPIFVAALALAAFANGLWMVVGGYFIRTSSLPRFWYYTFHFIGYQTYAFSLLVRNDFFGLIWPCASIQGQCSCPMPSSLVPGQCALAGSDIISNAGLTLSNGLSLGVLIAIIIVYRILMWVGLTWKKH